MANGSRKKGAIICLSGGIESTTLAYMLKKEMKYEDILAITVDYGHRARAEEIFCINKTAEILNIKVKEVDLKWLKEISGSYLTRDDLVIPEVKDDELFNKERAIERMKWWWVPARNLLIASVALAFAEHDLLYNNIKRDIFLGLRRELPLPMPDNTPEFVERLNRVFEYSILTYHTGEKIKVYAPLIEMTKEEVVRKGAEIGVRFEYTYSCYSGNNGKFINGLPVHCGMCSNCKKRKLAFKNANVKDPSIYLVPP